MRQGADLEALGYGERPHLNDLAGAGPDDRDAKDVAPLRGHDFDVAIGFSLRLRPVVLVVGPAQHVDLAVLCARLRFTEADVGKLGVGEDDPRHGAAGGSGAEAEQRSAEDDTGVVCSNVAISRAASRITDREDATVPRSETGVDFDRLIGDGDARGLESQIGNIGLPPGGNKQIAAFDGFGSVTAFNLDRDAVLITGDTGNPDAFADVDAFVGKSGEQDDCEFGIFVRNGMGANRSPSGASRDGDKLARTRVPSIRRR